MRRPPFRFWLFVGGLALISYAGNYGNGLGLLRQGTDMALFTLLSLAVFWLAVGTRLSDEETAALIAQSPAERA